MKTGVAVRQDELQAAPAFEAPKLRLVDDVPTEDGARGGATQLERVIDRLMGMSSLVSTAPLLDVRDFAWTCELRERWTAIKAEAADAEGEVSPRDHHVTAAILSRIPGLYAARFERLPVGAHLPVRRMASRGLLTCHLGLAVPRDGDLRMQLGGRVVRWAEGETLLFDATQAQAWRNDGSEQGLVLSVQLRRPLRQPARWLAETLLR
ncbi:aspartyl/asparaginyl beta-hydroxylase domain-containing protein [Sphingomonas sp. MG17]|uniref:Aspartyl/asparaginyl beta-hydroxylase domain-containing protein n=1 Tax=Sphingomonas tagetis TaxID=2949092 RepID=A0A9X2KKF9_9SPHN|nr:aspartyl/asparaginyl beta-hydroxylase domain-containing protein [Sphingomonas tagetis]